MLKKSRQLKSMNVDRSFEKKEEPDKDKDTDVSVYVESDCGSKKDSVDLQKMKLEYELEKVRLERRKTELEFSKLESTERMKRDELQFKREMIDKMLDIIKE